MTAPKRIALEHRAMFLAWRQMLGRCSNPKNSRFKFYGARGIRVCDRWRDFDAFFADMGPRPTPKHTVERKDNDGNYEPGNCVWALAKEQQNNKGNNVVLTFRGKTQTATQWAEEMGISPFTILQRCRQGWSADRILATPVSYRQKLLTFRGKTQTMKEWSAELGFIYQTLRARIVAGWSVEKALTHPLRRRA